MPMTSGMPMKKTMVVPCIVNRPCKTPREMNSRPGHSSCKRSRIAAMRRMPRKTTRTRIYRTATCLRPTEASHEWSPAVRALGGSAAHAVTVDAGLAKKRGLGVGQRGVLHRRLLVVGQPLLKEGGLIRVDAQEHVGMLTAAVLGTLAQEQARLFRLEP